MSPALPALAALCRARGVALVEDAAHAHGSALDGCSAGSFGIAGAFSFYPTKVIAGGEGGMIVTNDDDDRRRSAHVPRPGQGFVPCELPHPSRCELAHERAARRDRARRNCTASTSSSRRGKRSPRATTRPSSSTRIAAARHPVRPRTATTTSTSRSFPTASIARSSSRRCASDFDIGLSGEVYDTPLHQQPVFCAPRRTRPAGRRVAVRAAHLPAALPVADRQRRRLRRSPPSAPCWRSSVPQWPIPPE